MHSCLSTDGATTQLHFGWIPPEHVACATVIGPEVVQQSLLVSRICRYACLSRAQNGSDCIMDLSLAPVPGKLAAATIKAALTHHTHVR